MNTPQTILANLMTELPLMTKANGYQNDYIAPMKGAVLMAADNKYLRPMVFFQDSKAIPDTEKEEKGNITLPIIILIDFHVLSGQGNITDECEIILQDLIDFISGTFGAAKSFTPDWNTLNIEHLFISDFFRTFDWQTQIGRCGVLINCIYKGPI